MHGQKKIKIVPVVIGGFAKAEKTLWLLITNTQMREICGY